MNARILIGSSEQEMANKLEALVKHIYSKGREVNITKIQGPATSAEYFGI